MLTRLPVRTLFVLLLIAAPALAQIEISEIRIDQPSNDDDEYFELRGAPGTSLDGLTYVVIGDGTGGSGVIDTGGVIDLTGQVLDVNGFFVAAESTFSLGTADLTTTLGFENSDNVTHLLVTGFTGAAGDDLDTDDDCVLDITPWTAIIDSIALVETVGSGDCNYGPNSIGPDGTFVPGHVFRCHGDNWFIGEFDHLIGFDTPGAGNFEVFINGDFAADNSVNFTVCAENDTGNTAYVLFSCAGTSSTISTPNGRPIPLTFDSCTLAGLKLGAVFSGVVSGTGVANTPVVTVPSATPPGLTIYMASITISGTGINSIIGPTQFVSQ